MVLFRIALIAALGGFLFGYDVAVMGGAMLDLKDDLSVGEVMEEVLVGSAKAGAVVGTLLGGAAMLHYGRKRTLTAGAFAFLAGPLVMAFAPNVWVLLVGRVVVGVAVGASAVTVPVYLGELAPARLRGRVVESYEVMLTIGGLLAVLTNAALHGAPHNWRLMLGAPLIPALILLASVGFLPESPRWLVVNGRLQEALAVIHRVFTSTQLNAGSDQSTAEVEAELLDLWSSVQKEGAAVEERRSIEERRPDEGARILQPHPEPAGSEAGGRSDDAWDEADPSADASADASGGPEGPDATPDAAGDGRSLLPAARGRSDGSRSRGGVEAALGAGEAPGAPRRRRGSYARVLLSTVRDMWAVLRGPERRAVRMSLVLAFFNQAFASTSIISYAPTLLQKVGIAGAASANLAAAVVSASKLAGVLLALPLVDRAGRRSLLLWGSVACAIGLAATGVADASGSPGWLLAGMAAFALSFSASWAGVFWVLLSELFSMGVKSPAAAAATATLFAAGAASDAAFLSLHSLLGAALFALYAGIAALATVYVFFTVPETRGRTLAEVQALLAGGGMGDGDLARGAATGAGVELSGRPSRSNGTDAGLSSKGADQAV